jgi:exosortase
MEGQQLLTILIVQILIVGVIGVGAARGLAAPLLYLFFLVPFGEFLVPWLQAFTAHFITIGLNLFGVPNYVDGVTIEIPEGKFWVAEACAGLRFLIASAAFGVLYACVMYNEVWRRTIFIIISLAVPVIANGIRASGTVLAAHFIGSAESVEIDHLFYGWVFFSIVTILVMLLGLPFRNRKPSVTVRTGTIDSAPIAKAAVAAVALVAVIAAVPRLLAGYLDTLPPSAVAQLDFPALPGCEFAPVAAPLESKPVGDAGVPSMRGYRCDGSQLAVILERYPERTGARAIFKRLQPDWKQSGWEIANTRNVEVGVGARAQSWTETTYSRDRQVAIVATALWIEGRPAGGIRGRVAQALNTVRISPVAPVVATIVNHTPFRVSHVMDDFLTNSPALSDMIEAISPGSPINPK